MSSPSKNYKIIVDSKHFGNMKGIRPAEVAKKASSKILGLYNNKIIHFSMIEIKNGKIRNYKAFKENLIRPYKKNGKLIKCRIIVKKIGKHTGGGKADIFEKLYKQREFTEEDRNRIKDEMFIKNNMIYDSKINYEPYNLSSKIKELFANGASVNESFGNPEYFELGENDPILHFFPKSKFNIEFDSNDIGRMKLNYIDSDKRRCNIYYEFTGDEDSFELHIYNLRSCFDALTKEDASFLVYCWEKYINFLRKLYPRAISYEFYYDVPSSNNRNNRIGILEVPFENYSREFSSNEQKKYKVRVGLDFYNLFTKKSQNSNRD